MARLPEGFKLKLEPEDEFTHTPEAAQNYNESMYFNMFDPDQKVGGWFRIGNRPNEGYAEMSVCVYLPSGEVAFMFARPKISDNKEMNAGGLKIEVVEPFKKLKLTYDGTACLLKNPFEMAHPSEAFKSNPSVPVRIDLDYTGIAPMWGGETVKADGTPLELDAEKSFSRAHYEQHVAAEGTIEVDGKSLKVSGYGLRDKSWGPRYWQAIKWYRWCPMNFGPDFAMMVSIVAGDQGTRAGGMVFEDGAYHDLIDAEITSEWDENWYQTSLKIKAKTEQKSYQIDGRVLSLIPLRNRRKSPDGEELLTRITEGMTEFRCNGQVGYGLSEYLDQIVDGRPVSLADAK